MPVGLHVLQRLDVLRPHHRRSAPRRRSRTWPEWPSRARLWSTTWRCSIPSTPMQLPTKSIAARFARSIIWRRGATWCCASRKCFVAGMGWGCDTCSWVWRPSTTKGCGDSASGRPGSGFQALEVARRLGITVAVNIIADPQWDVRAIRGGSPLGGVGARDRPSHGCHAVSRHGDLGCRGPPTDDARLPAVRHPARGAADAAAAGAVLRGVGAPRRRCSTASTWALRPAATPFCTWPGCWPAGRPISSVCCGSSIGCIMPRVRRPTIGGKCGTRWRCRAVGWDENGQSSIEAQANQVFVQPDASRPHPLPDAGRRPRAFGPPAGGCLGAAAGGPLQ